MPIRGKKQISLTFLFSKDLKGKKSKFFLYSQNSDFFFNAFCLFSPHHLVYLGVFLNSQNIDFFVCLFITLITPSSPVLETHSKYELHFLRVIFDWSDHGPVEFDPREDDSFAESYLYVCIVLNCICDCGEKLTLTRCSVDKPYAPARKK